MFDKMKHSETLNHMSHMFSSSVQNMEHLVDRTSFRKKLKHDKQRPEAGTSLLPEVQFRQAVVGGLRGVFSADREQQLGSG